MVGLGVVVEDLLLAWLGRLGRLWKSSWGAEEGRRISSHSTWGYWVHLMFAFLGASSASLWIRIEVYLNTSHHGVGTLCPVSSAHVFIKRSLLVTQKCGRTVKNFMVNPVLLGPIFCTSYTVHVCSMYSEIRVCRIFVLSWIGKCLSKVVKIKQE